MPQRKKKTSAVLVESNATPVPPSSILPEAKWVSPFAAKQVLSKFVALDPVL